MGVDHGKLALSMEEMAISKFKAKCLAVLERVRKTRQPVLITRFGEPVAEGVPPHTPAPPTDWIGSLRSTGKIEGDIVSPASDEEDWEVLRR
jgi:antitoxin (DNA-binding transcriptional repressor) of toxin-antitoxin stability system